MKWTNKILLGACLYYIVISNDRKDREFYAETINNILKEEIKK